MSSQVNTLPDENSPANHPKMSSQSNTLPDENSLICKLIATKQRKMSSLSNTSPDENSLVRKLMAANQQKMLSLVNRRHTSLRDASSLFASCLNCDLDGPATRIKRRSTEVVSQHRLQGRMQLQTFKRSGTAHMTCRALQIFAKIEGEFSSGTRYCSHIVNSRTTYSNVAISLVILPWWKGAGPPNTEEAGVDKRFKRWWTLWWILCGLNHRRSKNKLLALCHPNLLVVDLLLETPETHEQTSCSCHPKLLVVDLLLEPPEIQAQTSGCCHPKPLVVWYWPVVLAAVRCQHLVEDDAIWLGSRVQEPHCLSNTLSNHLHCTKRIVAMGSLYICQVFWSFHWVPWYQERTWPIKTDSELHTKTNRLAHTSFFFS